MQIKDAKTGKMREETDDERKAREAEEARAKEEEGEGDEEKGDDDDDVTKLRKNRDHWKGEARKWEARAKENKSAADELKKLQTEKLSDAEKAAQATKDATARAEKAEQDALRLRIASRKGLNESQAKRLVGTTEEELEADADDLLKTFKGKSDDEEEEETESGKRTERKPSEKFRPTTTRSGTGKQTSKPADARKIVDEAMGVTR